MTRFPSIVVLFVGALSFSCTSLAPGESTESIGYHQQALWGDCAPTLDSPTPASPQLVGTAIAINSTPNCIGGIPENRYYAQTPSGTWNIVCDWTTSNSCNWDTTSYGPGVHTLQVWTRMQGNTDPDGSSAYVQYTLDPSACTTASMTSSAATSPVGAAVNLTAASTCPVGWVPQYQFWAQNPSTYQWEIVCPWQDGTACQWTPVVDGSYALQVWVRRTGQTNPDVTSSYTYVNVTEAGGACGTATITGTPTPGVVAINQPVQLQAAATEYQFWAFGPGGWQIVCPWQLGDTCDWTPTAVYNYTIQVWARGQNNTRAFDTSDYIVYQAQ